MDAGLIAELTGIERRAREACERSLAEVTDLANTIAILNHAPDAERDKATRARLEAIARLAGGASEDGYATITLFGEAAVTDLLALGGERSEQPTSGGRETIVSTRLSIGSVHISAQYNVIARAAVAESAVAP